LTPFTPIFADIPQAD